MKKVRIPLMIQDIRTAHEEDLPNPTEGFDAIQDFFLDGPVTKRVAVLDIDPDTGELNDGVRLERTDKGKIFYSDIKGNDILKYKGSELYSPEFLQVSTFATVLKTLDLFEKELGVGEGEMEEDPDKKFGVLGRELKWAFDSPQLFIIPRAGEMPNAYYNRATNSLEFFFFPSLRNKKEIVYSALSREIVAHEAGHAIIDAIAPDLMDAYTPDSLAIHEGLADMVALFVSFSSTNLTKFILDGNDGSIREESHFTNLAEEFAMGSRGEARLRNFLNEKNFIKESKHYVGSLEPHAMCEVLTGAIYKVLIDLHESKKKELVNKRVYANKPNPQFSASGFALMIAYQQIKRILFRALDYLPPGEVTFADYGRAIAAADRVENKFNFLRNWFAKEFVRRGLSSNQKLLLTDTSRGIILKVDFDKLVSSNWYAYEFVKENHKLLKIPPRTNFELHSCHLVNYYNGKRKGKKMCVFKISWVHEEEGDLGDNRLPKKRLVKMGTTLLMDVENSKVHACLTNACPSNNADVYGVEKKQDEYADAKKRRSSFLKHLFKAGMLKLNQNAIGPDGKPLQNIVQGEIINGVLRVRGAAKSLHVCK